MPQSSETILTHMLSSISRFKISDLKHLIKNHPNYSHFLYDFKKAQEDIHEAKDDLNLLGFKKVFYSVKANPQPFLIKEIEPSVDGFDISSFAEMDLLLKLGIPAGRLSFSGPAKTQRSLQLALSQKIGFIHLDSLDEFERVSQLQISNQNSTQLTLRLPTPGHSSDKLGFSDHDLEKLFMKMQHSLQIAKPVFSGFHFYLGRERFSEVLLQQAIKKAGDALSQFKDTFSEFPELYIGLGLPAQRIWSKNKLLNFTQLNSMNFKLNCEIGRGLIHSSGAYLSKVLSVKDFNQRKIITIDGGLQHLTPSFGSQNFSSEDVEVIFLDPEGNQIAFAGNEESTDEIVGSLSLWHDRILVQQKIPRTLQRNCWVLMSPTGTYGWTAAISQFLGSNSVKEWKLTDSARPTEITPPHFSPYHQSFYENS